MTKYTVDGEYGNMLMELVEILHVCTNFELVTLVTLKIKGFQQCGELCKNVCK